MLFLQHTYGSSDSTGTTHNQLTIGYASNELAACSAEDRAAQAAILEATSLWRPLPDDEWEFTYNGYPGPWIEETFYEHWINATNGGCPVGGRFFLPINFNLCHRFCSPEELQGLEDYLLRVVDPTKKYFTVLLLDKGIGVLGIAVPKHLDLLIFASGGITKGGNITNVPIPLLKQELAPAKPPLPRDIFASFAGTLETHSLRTELANLYYDTIEFHAPQLGTDISDWQTLMQRSVFCMSPRGYGATSFRTFEAIQLGCIPVYVWDEDLMLPFAERVDWNSFAVIIERKEMLDLERKLREADIPAMQAAIERVRHMMTYEYTCRYILEYLSGKGAPSHAKLAEKPEAAAAALAPTSAAGAPSLFSSVANKVIYRFY